MCVHVNLVGQSQHSQRSTEVSWSFARENFRKKVHQLSLLNHDLHHSRANRDFSFIIAGSLGETESGSAHSTFGLIVPSARPLTAILYIFFPQSQIRIQRKTARVCHTTLDRTLDGLDSSRRHKPRQKHWTHQIWSLAPLSDMVSTYPSSPCTTSYSSSSYPSIHFLSKAIPIVALLESPHSFNLLSLIHTQQPRPISKPDLHIGLKPVILSSHQSKELKKSFAHHSRTEISVCLSFSSLIFIYQHTQNPLGRILNTCKTSFLNSCTEHGGILILSFLTTLMRSSCCRRALGRVCQNSSSV